VERFEFFPRKTYFESILCSQFITDPLKKVTKIVFTKVAQNRFLFNMLANDIIKPYLGTL
jgi:hypothetical protein